MGNARRIPDECLDRSARILLNGAGSASPKGVPSHHVTLVHQHRDERSKRTHDRRAYRDAITRTGIVTAASILTNLL
jgi:hypothetical protein